MTGTFINMAAIAAGTTLGSFAGSKLPAGMRRIVLYGIGLITMLIGFQMAARSQNVLVVMGAILIGGIIGELLKIEQRIEKIGAFLQEKLARGSSHTFGEGFVTASLVFCVGPMAVLGSIADGLSGDYSLLSIKSVLDGFASVAFAASLGWGVGASMLSIFVYQGSITLFAGSLSSILSEPMVAEMSATGGLIIIGIGIKLLDLKNLPLANFIPAIAIAPLILTLIPLVKGFVGYLG